MRTETYYVAYSNRGYACRGEKVGPYGYAIVSTNLVDDVSIFKSETPAGLMRQLGGHYRGYVPVKVTKQISLLRETAWPDPKEAFDDA